MARTLKKTRIKGLPPRLQLQQRDAVTGSFPTRVRLASDNRTGFLSGSFYNDSRGLSFTSFNRLTASFDANTDYSDLNYFAGAELVLWWRFESTGSDGLGQQTWVDSETNAHHNPCAYTNVYSQSTDIPSYYYRNEEGAFANRYSIYMGSTTGTRSLGDQDSAFKSEHDFAPNNPFSISLHVKPTQTTYDSGSLWTAFGLFYRGRVNNMFADWELFVNTSDQSVRFAVFNSNTGKHKVWATSGSMVPVDTWTHVVMTFDGTSDLQLYVNGVAQSTSVIRNTGWSNMFSNTTDAGAWLGLLADGDYLGVSRVTAQDVKFDNAMLFNRVLTSAEVQALQTMRQSSDGVAMPSGLPKRSQELLRWSPQYNTLVENEEMNTTLFVSGVVRKGVGDAFVTFPHAGQQLQPFRDDHQPASDAKSVLVGSGSDPFWATGSNPKDVGEGFDQPLWSKTKIEIDITPSQAHSFFIQNNLSSSQNFPMAYWNKDRKMWEGIGLGKEFGTYISTSHLPKFLEEQPIGFSRALNFDPDPKSAGQVTSIHGFPYHAKFHGTSSNCINISDYIQEPFLVEKIVLEWSGGLYWNNTSQDFVGYHISTFFILNQRKPFGYSDPNFQVVSYGSGVVGGLTLVTGAQVPGTPPGGTPVNTIRDLITFAQVSRQTIWSAGTTRELDINDGDIPSPYLLNLGGIYAGGWAGSLVMSGVVKSSFPNDHASYMSFDLDGVSTLFASNKHGTRSGLFSPSGRDFVGGIANGNVAGTFFVSPGQASGSFLDNYTKPNPYLLLPGDQLILGWQLPLPPILNVIGAGTVSPVPMFDGKGLELLFAVAPSKLTLYGSSVREGKEHHDTLNQLLTSVTVNEVIG